MKEITGKLNPHGKNEKGAVVVLIAILLVVLLGIAAFAIDFGYRNVVRNELQNAADAAALAAARQLSAIYQTMSYAEQQTYVCDRTTVAPTAQEAALKNYAGEVSNLLLADADILIGQWNTWKEQDKDDRVNNYNRPDAIMVTTRREAGVNGPISTFFGHIFNVSTMPVSASATAALTGQGVAEPGEIELPVGISKYWFENNTCLDEIAFSPSNDPSSCAGWHTFDADPASDSKIRDLLENYIETGSSGSPHTVTGETDYEFIGGDLSKNTFDALMVAFQKSGYDISGYDSDGLGIPITDATGNPLVDATGNASAITLCEDTSTPTGVTRCDSADSSGTPAYYPDDPTTKGVTEHVARNLHAWQTTVPVYDRDDCSNPNQNIDIVGFALVEIHDVGNSSDKTIKAKVLCDYVEFEEDRGGGGSFGVKGPIPGLVE